MADEDHLRILREGIDAWNRWREEHPDVHPELRSADLRRMDLSGARLGRAGLMRADLVEARLRQADLRGANLIGAYLNEADLSGADLTEANLGRADLHEANLAGVNLSGASLDEADLIGANLSWANLRGANLRQAKVRWTVFANVDLSDVEGLESVWQDGPSTIGIDTVYRSQGRIPEAFLRGAGVSDEFITYVRSLVGRPIEYYSCFISYSSKDQAFAERLHADLQAKGVRCWFAPEDLKVGDRFRQRIDEAIRIHDKLLLILSRHSVASDWVATEVEAALEKERLRGQTVLFPVRIDDPIMTTDQAWAADVRRTRHIGDFTQWKDHDTYAAAFDRLMRDLKAAKA